MKKNMIFIQLFLILFIVGCTKNNKKSDIEKYIDEKIKIKKYSISDSYVNVEDDDNTTDRIWTVYDKVNNISFHVIDDYFYSTAIGTGHHLLTDYYESLFLKYYNEKKSDNRLVLKKSYTGDYIDNLYINCKYNNKEELTDCYDSLKNYKKYLSKKMNKIPIRYQVAYSYYDYYDFEFYNYFQNFEDLNEVSYKNMLNYYYSYGLIHQLDVIMNEMSETDLKNVYEYKNTKKVCKRNENNSEECYERIVADFGTNVVGFGALFKILQQENYNPVGTPMHYTVVGKDGNTYEFSYDFEDNMSDEDETNAKPKSYYIKNGKKIYGSFHNLRTVEIKEIFDLDLYCPYSTK